MARTLAAGEAFQQLTQVRWLTEQIGTHGDTTTTEAILGDGTETAFDVTAATNFTAADTCIISGSGGMEAVVIGTPAATMPISPPPLIAQATGALFYEAQSIDLGKIAKNSVNWTSTSALTPVFEELSRTPMLYIPGNIEFGLSIGLYGFNPENFQFINGFLEAVTGNGAAYATAIQGIVGKPSQSLQVEQILRLRGVRHDAKNIEMDFCNAKIEAQANVSMGSDTPAVLNFTAKATAVIARYWT